MSLVNHLKNAGLGDKEAKVYLAMLELGPSSVLEIASKAGVNRPTCYLQIEELKKKGLVSTQKKGKKDLYIAESPDQLETLIDQEAKNFELKKEEIKKAIPELEALFNLSGDKPVVRYFEGVDGIKKILDEFLKSKEKKLQIISCWDIVEKNMPIDIWDNYGENRLKKQIAVDVIYVRSKNSVERKTDLSKLREVRILDADKFPFKADITIFDDNVAISNLVMGKMGGTIITDKIITGSFKAIFDLLWKQSLQA